MEKIKKLKELDLGPDRKGFYDQSEFGDKINELIDEVNKLRDEK